MAEEELNFHSEKLAEAIVKGGSVEEALREFGKDAFNFTDKDFEEDDYPHELVARVYKHYLKTKKAKASKKSGKAKKSSSTKRGQI